MESYEPLLFFFFTIVVLFIEYFNQTSLISTSINEAYFISQPNFIYYFLYSLLYDPFKKNTGFKKVDYCLKFVDK